MPELEEIPDKIEIKTTTTTSTLSTPNLDENHLDKVNADLDRVNAELTLLTGYKSELEERPNDIIADKISKCDFHLGKGLGESMREHLTNHKADLQADPNKHILAELEVIDNSIIESEKDKTKLEADKITLADKIDLEK